MSARQTRGHQARPRPPLLPFTPPPCSYVLAEMSVHQTREHFIAKEGAIVDNPNVRGDGRHRLQQGPALAAG